MKTTGSDLWNLFLRSEAPDPELVALGECAGHLEARANPMASQALLKIAMRAAQENGVIVFTPSHLFTALKDAMPSLKLVRRGLLHGVAFDYEKRRAYSELSGDVKHFLEEVAENLSAITANFSPPSPPSPQPSAPPATTMGAKP